MRCAGRRRSRPERQRVTAVPPGLRPGAQPADPGVTVLTEPWAGSPSGQQRAAEGAGARPPSSPYSAEATWAQGNLNCWVATATSALPYGSGGMPMAPYGTPPGGLSEHEHRRPERLAQHDLFGPAVHGPVPRVQGLPTQLMQFGMPAPIDAYSGRVPQAS
jgi:hypothetical protein